MRTRCGGGRAGLLHSNHCEGAHSCTNPNLISGVSLRARQHIAKALAVGALSFVAASAVQADATCPARGTTVQPIQSSIAEEAFSDHSGLQGAGEAGYTVKAPQETEYATGHLALPMVMPPHGHPLGSAARRTSIATRAATTSCGGRAPMCAIPAGLPDRQEDRRPIQDHPHLATVRPGLAKLFDTNGDGKADLTGCNPAGAVELVIEHQLGLSSCAAPSRTTRAAMPH